MTSFQNYSNGSNKATPLVPHSQTINKICKPSYASLYANATPSTNPNPPPPVAPKPPKHKKPMKMTLDLDSAVDLDSAIKALEHKKKMLEAKMVQAAGSGNQNNIPPPTAQKSQFYENVMHQGGGGNQDKLIYSNIMHGTATGGPQNLHHELSIDPNTNEEDEFEFPPPPSPVSSSYSELRRATDGTNHRIPNNTGNIAAQQHHQPQNHHMQTYSNDYGIYGNNSTTYESIYEPINPRPPSQMSSYSLYAPYGDASAYSNTPRSNRNQESEVDALTDLLVESMQQSSLGTDNYGVCVKCNGRIMDENSGCTAMEQIYHIACFTCQHCQINLQGKPFYVLDGMPYCENDYMDTLEKCSVCLSPILERILRATGKPYHPRCFCCVVCGKSLDGIPFTVDATNQIHCIEDFHKKFAPRCCVCQEPIMPEPGQEETVRVVALDRSFHISCYKCEDCGLILSSEAEGRGCYPLDDHVLCKSCNATRVQALTSYM